MAITIQAQLAKKIPGEINFSSKQASITISAEVTDLNQVVAEAARLYALAEKAVDAQLAQHAVTAPPLAASSQLSASSPAPTQSPVQRPVASQPYRANPQRRAPAPVTESQLRFLDRLIQQTGSSVPAILEQHQVGALRDISCKAAAGLIDELKALVPA